MEKLFNSTRDNNNKLSPSKAIIKGLSDDGGLFVPEFLKDVKFNYKDFIGKSYNYIAKIILSEFLDFSKEQIDYCVDTAYSLNNFETEDIFKVVDVEDGLSILELFSGNTIAFKDCALSILPLLLKCAKENENDKDDVLILTATSGDTGKAALEGFHDVDGIDVIVYYPYKGVSRLQLLQMLTQKGSNVKSYAVKGNFDDTQAGVKEIFNDSDFEKELEKYGVKLSSANSINIGRLLPQVVYYYHSYVRLIEQGKIKEGDKVNFIVPTGNFGNILAGYYAYLTGLPVYKLICASNDNNVLFDFFKSGVYDKNREFKKTISPSMDILISSNLERLIYHMYDGDDKKVKDLMTKLNNEGKYTIDSKYMSKADNFIGGYATEDEIRKVIKKVYEEDDYLMDTHTAAGYMVYKDTKENDDTYSVLLSTASPYKFSKDVYDSIFEDDVKASDDVEYMYKLNEKTNVNIPKPVNNIESFERREEEVITKENMRNSILKYIEGKK
ncbi:threonine synthase [Anaerofustis stercorihominis]|uniref:threonine synthase n=1 Tax=Anaerofustis stercorihominis TaxID=214853 RepID=UPI00214C8F83|nr:threonine synthase [Anaerofustis stercorihominis]MCR2032221.1 threonine synthase [Anaerofustis stercorihominis]